MKKYTIEEVETRIRNAEIIYDRALQNNAGLTLLKFLVNDLNYWTAVLADLKEQPEENHQHFIPKQVENSPKT